MCGVLLTNSLLRKTSEIADVLCGLRFQRHPGSWGMGAYARVMDGARHYLLQGNHREIQNKFGRQSSPTLSLFYPQSQSCQLDLLP